MDDNKFPRGLRNPLNTTREKRKAYTSREEAPAKPYSTLYDASFNRTWSNVFQKNYHTSTKATAKPLSEQQEKFGEHPTSQRTERFCSQPPSTVRATAYRTLPEDNITGYVFPDPEPDPWTPERVITHLPPNPKSRNKLLYHETSLLPENRTAAYIGKKKEVAIKPNEVMQDRRLCEPHMCTDFVRRSNATTQFEDSNPSKLFHNELDIMIKQKFHGQSIRDADKPKRRSSAGSGLARSTLASDGIGTKKLTGGGSTSSSRRTSKETENKTSSRTPSTKRNSTDSQGDSRSSKKSLGTSSKSSKAMKESKVVGSATGDSDGELSSSKTSKSQLKKSTAGKSSRTKESQESTSSKGDQKGGSAKQ
ncbi:uncharacterized protein LOC142346233 [Convolutriloba macropyga]|uniref:uncharacterized protein LOC142346233 n=1 Tax=Convolutriloba macropyga TaxID=536237 RepID=UPI003F523168